MFFRRTTIKSRETGEPYYTYRLVESVRTADTVRQRRILNVHVKQRLDFLRRIDRRLGLGHVDLAPAAQRLGDHEVVRGAQAPVLVIVALGPTGLSGLRWAPWTDN